MSEINALATKKPKKKKKHHKSLNANEAETKLVDRTCVEVNEQNINGSDLTENDKKLSNKKNFVKCLNLMELNTTNDVEMKLLESTYEKVNKRNIIGSYSKKNVNRKRKSEKNTLAGISFGDNCNYVNENIPIKKRKKKNHDVSLNSIVLNTNETENQIIEKVYEEVNDSDFRENARENVNQSIQHELYISLENKCVAIKKSKKKKKHDVSLNFIKLNTNNDGDHQNNEQIINDSDVFENKSQTIMSEINALPTKKTKKKKNHSKRLNSIELETNHDNEIQIFEKTHEEVNDQSINGPDHREDINQRIQSELSSDILLENKCYVDNDNVATKKSNKKRKHNKSLNSIEKNTNNEVNYRMYERDNEQNINVSDSVDNINQTIMSEINALPTKKTKKKKNHSKSLNSIELETNHDNEIQIFEKTHKEVNDQSINSSDHREDINQRIQSELSSPTDILLKNKCSVDSDNVATKKSNKKRKHNKSLNSIEINPNNEVNYRMYEKDNEQNINVSDSVDNINQTIMSEINALPTKKTKKKKNHSKSLNSIELETNHDNEIQIFEKTHEKVNYQSINSPDYRENINQRIQSELSSDILLENKCYVDSDNVATKKSNKKRKHNKSLNSIEKNTNNEVNYRSSPTDILLENKLSSASLEINYSLDNENLANKESKKSKKHNILKTVISNCNSENKMPMISQDRFRVKNLLNSLDLLDSEKSSSIIKTDRNLKRFNLMKYLTNKDPSLKNHPNFKKINEHLSKKIKQAINKECKMGASDILLLKTVGKIILKKIVEKIDAAQDLKGLIIRLPPECCKNKIHFLETTLCRLPNKHKMDIIKKQNPLIKLGVFNKDEDNMIQEYWSKFQKEYNISNILPFLSNGLEMALSPIERMQFIRYISAGLPNRLLYSVYNRFNLLFNKYQNKTPFSEEEDQLIMKVDKCDAIKNKFSVLSLILNRTRIQLYRRLEVLNDQHIKCKKLFWDDQMRQELFTKILLVTNTEHWKDLKKRTITKYEWIEIANELGENFTYKKVRYHWIYLYTMLFCEKPILMSTFNLIIMDLLEKINPKHWSDLNWIEITNLLYPGANSKVICGFFHSWVSKKVPSNIKENIRDTLIYLRKYEVEKLQQRINKRGEREFPRLTVKHYDLLVNNNE